MQRRRIRIERPRAPRERWWLEALPLDPRDEDVVRAKCLAGAGSSAAACRVRTAPGDGAPLRRR